MELTLVYETKNAKMLSEILKVEKMEGRNEVRINQTKKGLAIKIKGDVGSVRAAVNTYLKLLKAIEKVDSI